MNVRFHHNPWALACAGLIAWGAAGLALAQGNAAPAHAPCQSAQLQPAQLYGQWSLLLWPVDGTRTSPMATGTAHFERHPEFPGSVRGRLTLSTAAGQTLLSGDATDGEFQLDESEDGVAISAVWHAVVNPADCGQRLQGTRRPAEGRPASEVLLNFELNKVPGWQ
ncbi:MAG TPA: hypothetical protein VFY22_09940 [Hydrogenophaga sp.]|nr:hypothetical protein [Hydrogenophaga sp.]